MLAPVYALAGLSPLALKLVVVLTYSGFLLVFYFLTNSRFSPTQSLLAVSLFAFNPELLLFLDSILSDIPFLFLSTLALLIADLYTRETLPKRRLMLAIITGLALFAAYFVRTQGLILLGSVLLFQGLHFLGQRKIRRQLVCDSMVILVTFVIMWGISSPFFPGGQTSYLALYEGFRMEILTGNITSYSGLFSEFFASLTGQDLIFATFVILFFIGLITRYKTDLLFVLYAALYLAVLWTWPEWQGYRFIFPLLPLFIYFSFQGIRYCLSRLPKKGLRGTRIFVYTTLMIFCAVFIFLSTSTALGNLQAGREINGPFDPVSRETYEFIKNETPSGSILVFFKPRAMRLMTDRISLASTDCERMSLGNYLVLSKKVGENLQIPPERIDECNLPLERVFQNRRFIVYELLD